MNCTPLFARVRIASASRHNLRPCEHSSRPASLHVKLHAIEFGHVEVDELASDVAVVCPERLACRHMGDNLALDDALLAPGDFSR